MNKQPLVSILIACYNGQKFINRCLETCISQSYRKIEIIIINDGSTDISLNILKKWESIDSRIRIINQTNVGLGETRNRLIKACNGEYFTFVDIDDTIPKNAIELMVNNSDNSKNDIVVARTKLVYKNKGIRLPFMPSWRYVRNMTNGHFVKSNLCTPWACLIKTSYFKSLNINFIPGRIFEDIGVMTYVFIKCKNFKFIKDVVYFYHKHKKDKFNDKQLSSFKTLCFKKNDDVYIQTDQLLKYLSAESDYNSKIFKRYINGVLFQIIPLNIFLTKNLTKNKYIRYILRYNLNTILSRYQIKPKYSKTLWKSFAYFYVILSNINIYSNNGKFKKKMIFGTYGNMKHNNSYQIIPYKQEYPLYPKKNKIYELTISQLLNNALPLNLNKVNISLVIDSFNKKDIDAAFNQIYKMNAIPFASIHTKLNEDQIKWVLSKCIGINFFVDKDNYMFYAKVLNDLNLYEQKKLLFVTVSNREILSNEITSNIYGVFENEEF